MKIILDETSPIYTVKDYYAEWTFLPFNWRFTQKDIDWINLEIGPYDFSLYNSNAEKLY